MNKYAKPYDHVIHATEQVRRDKFQGCVSRQTLRAQLRREEQKALRVEGPTLPHAVIRLQAHAEARYQYRRLMGLEETRPTKGGV